MGSPDVSANATGLQVDSSLSPTIKYVSIAVRFNLLENKNVLTGFRMSYRKVQGAALAPHLLSPARNGILLFVTAKTNKLFFSSDTEQSRCGAVEILA